MDSRRPRYAPGMYFLAAFIFLAVLPTGVYAFGSLAQEDRQNITEQQSAKFTLLFWGENESVDVWAEKYPSDWVVIVDPQKIYLDQQGDEYFSLGSKYVAAKKVNVFIKPNNSTDGKVIIGSRTSLSNNGVSFYAERYFNLTVQVGEKDAVNYYAEKNHTQNIAVNETHTEVKKGEKPDFYIIIFLAVLVAAALIYKFV